MVLRSASSHEDVVLRRRPASQETLTRKTRLLRKIGPMAMRSSVTSKIALSRTILRWRATNDLEIASLNTRPAFRKNAVCDPGLGSISSSRCQKSRMPLHHEAMHAKLCLLRGRFWCGDRLQPVFAFGYAGHVSSFPAWLRHAKPKGRSVVEPDGIEPTTSCLQSTRSPS